MSDFDNLVKLNLREVLKEIAGQPEVGREFPDSMQSFAEQVAQVSEYIELAHEYSIAYEVLVALLERFPFRISGKGAVRLLEVGLILRFKTEREEDAQFDAR